MPYHISPTSPKKSTGKRNGLAVTRYAYNSQGKGCSITDQSGSTETFRYDRELLNKWSTAYVTGQNKTVENSCQYDAFGNLLERREDVTDRIFYTSKQYARETGQYFLRARYYNPVAGRFLQEDTYRSDGLNRYAYCANNPVMYYDPSGHNAGKKLEEWCKKLAEAFMGDTPAGEVIGESGKKTEVLLLETYPW